MILLYYHTKYYLLIKINIYIVPLFDRQFVTCVNVSFVNHVTQFCIKTYLQYIIQQKYLDNNKIKCLKSKIKRNLVKKYFAIEEVNRLISLVEKYKNIVGNKDVKTDSEVQKLKDNYLQTIQK